MRKTAVAVAALAAVVAACAWAEPDSPYRQHMDGIQLEGIVCRDGFVLLGSPDLVPACVTKGTALILSERGWTTVDGSVDLGRIVIDSRNLPTEPGAPVAYPYPVVIVDYPEQMRVGQEYSIYVDYTYSQIPERYSLPDPHTSYLYFTFGGNIDLLSTGFVHLQETRIGTGGPYEHTIRKAYKATDIDHKLWYKEEIRFRINAPMNYHGNQLHINVGGMVVHGWLSTDDAGIVTVSATQHFPDSSLDEDGRNKYRSRALEAPEDQGTGFPPINDDLYEFLKEHIQPHWDVPEWLRTEGDFPQDYIDELLAAYPDLAEPAEQADLTSGQSSASRFVYLYGHLKVYDSSGRSLGAADVKACAKDVNLTTRVASTLYNGATPSCYTTNNTGFFRAAIPLSDPDNDGTRPDVQMVFSLDNSRVRVRDNMSTTGVYEYEGKTINNAKPQSGVFINYGTVQVPTDNDFQRPYWVFERVYAQSHELNFS